MKNRSDILAGNTPRERGFTLVEMLAAVVVLSLLLSFLFQALNASVAITQFNTRRLTASEEARTVFDRIDLDWENRLHNGGAQLGLIKGTPNDEVYWNTSAPAPTAGRSFACCDYNIAVDSVTNKLALERGVEAYDWTTTGSGTLAGPNLFIMPPAQLTTPTNFQTLSTGVLRFEITPVTNNSTASRNNGTPAAGTLTSTNYVGFYVTIVSLDQTTMAKLSSSTVSSLAALFTKQPATSTASIYQAWQTLLNTSTSFNSVERGNLLVSERYYNWDQ